MRPGTKIPIRRSGQSSPTSKSTPKATAAAATQTNATAAITAEPASTSGRRSTARRIVMFIAPKNASGVNLGITEHPTREDKVVVQKLRSVARADNSGWSLNGAQRAQPVASGGKWNGFGKRLKQAKTLPQVATGCMRRSMVRVHSL